MHILIKRPNVYFPLFVAGSFSCSWSIYQILDQGIHEPGSARKFLGNKKFASVAFKNTQCHCGTRHGLARCRELTGFVHQDGTIHSSSMTDREMRSKLQEL